MHIQWLAQLLAKADIGRGCYWENNCAIYWPHLGVGKKSSGLLSNSFSSTHKCPRKVQKEGHEYILSFTEPISCHATLRPTVQLKGQIQIWKQKKSL